MNPTNKTVEGVVEARGARFNGSLLIDNIWYNFKKGVTSNVNKGDAVLLTLEPWDFKGKTGYNISNVKLISETSSIDDVIPSVLDKPETKHEAKQNIKPDSKIEVKTDWNAKDRSQFVGGRSHDAVELVKVVFQAGVKKEEVLTLYKEMLISILEMSKEIK